MSEPPLEAGEEAQPGDEEPAERLLPPGNPLRMVRAVPLIAAGAVLTFVVMATTRQFRWGVPLAALGTAVATVGVLDLIGSFDDPDDKVAARVGLRELLAPLSLLAGGALGCAAMISLAVAGFVPVVLMAIAVPASFVLAVVGVHAIGERLGAWGDEPDPPHAPPPDPADEAREDAAESPPDAQEPARTSLTGLLAAVRDRATAVFASGGATDVDSAVARVADAARRLLPAVATAGAGRAAGGAAGAEPAASPPAARREDRSPEEPAEGAATKPRIHERHGFWVVLATTLLYLPMLGSHSLSDPWETHYGEVAREMLARNDWISPWWAQEGWFWSKPVLDFWIQALAMATFGVRYQPGEMLSAAAQGRTPWPEWAVRLPIFLMTLVATYLLYKAASRVFGRRAGLLGALVLATMPQWFFVSHQTMTDMPFVAAMGAAMALFLLGVHTEPEREVRVYEICLGSLKLRVSLFHLIFGAIIASVVPQILYLLSRNVAIELSPFAIRGHIDTFTSGSAQNCGLPGNEACRPWTPTVRNLHPALQALIWVQALSVLLYLNWGERRASRLFFHAAWYFAALSTMAKGPAGFGLPVLCALVYVAVTRRWRDLLRMEVLSGLLILAAVALPWFVAMYARHGQPFTDRIVFHDMFKRAFTHVHDTNEGDDVSFRYYVWQLGYATFPWVGLLPSALVGWMRRREQPDDRRGDGSVFFGVWFVLAFAGFSLMLTKFHHYILPAVPAAAMLIGVLLDDMLRSGSRGERSLARSAPYLAAMGVGALLSVYGLAGALARDASTASVAVRLGAALVGLTVQVGSAALLSQDRNAAGRGSASAMASVPAYATAPVDPTDETPALPPSHAERYESLVLGVAAIAGALLVALVGRDLAGDREALQGETRLLHLFTYNYKRPWPTSLEYSHVLWAFTAVAALATLLLVVARWRRHATVALTATALLFAAWGIDVYFVKTSPHWGQRETILAYHEATREQPGPIVAYQMNWKGENFYTGNRIPAFVQSGKKFQDWLAEEKKNGVRTFYFLTEHGRTGSLSNELGSPAGFEKLTTPELNNKFLLVRASFE